MYQRLALGLGRVIRHGHLPPGARLPSERELARALAVSRTTVVTAYELLREEGMLESRRGSGTRVAASAPVLAPALPVTATGSLLLDSRGVIDCSYSVMRTLDGFPDEALSVSADDVHRLTRQFPYEPLGLPTLRAAIAERYTRLGLPTTADEIMITTGAQQAIDLVFGLFARDHGTIVLEDPTYVGALDAARVAGATLIGVPIDEQGAEPRRLRSVLARPDVRLVYLMPSCHNPTGAVMSLGRREEIARLADQASAVVVDDMTLGLLSDAATGQVPLAQLSRAATVVTIDSFSKTFLAGLRVGWLRAPASLMEGLARLKVVSDLGSSHVSQILALRLFPFIDDISQLRRRQLQERLRALTEALGQELPDWSWTMPRGGACLWVEMPVGDGEAFAQVAFRHGVRVLPGVRMSPSDGMTRYLRISFVSEPAELVEAVHRLKAAWSVFERSSASERAPIEVAV